MYAPAAGDAVGNPDLRQAADRIAQIPPADVDRSVGRIVKFNRIDFRLNRVCEHFVDDYVANRSAAFGSRRTTVLGAAAPTVGVAEITRGIEELQGASVAVGPA